MGRYMIVVLKKQYKNDDFIAKINDTLVANYHAADNLILVTRKFLQKEADFFNTDPEGSKQLTYVLRPITAKGLHISFYKYRIGEFHCKLSGGVDPSAAMYAVAVCKWIAETKEEYVDRIYSDNYSKEIVGQYLYPVFSEKGINLESNWK